MGSSAMALPRDRARQAAVADGKDSEESMNMAEAVGNQRHLGNEMEDMLAEGLPRPKTLFPESEGGLTLGTFKREPVMQQFWLESQRVAGAILLNHRTAQLQKEQVLASIRLWQANAEFDGDTTATPVLSTRDGDTPPTRCRRTLRPR